DELQKEFGIDPENKVYPIPICLIFGRSIPILFGSLPLSLFFVIPIVLKDEILKRDEGNIPDRLFSALVKKSRLPNRPNSFGIFPSNSNCARARIASDERFPREGGIFPFKLFILS
ncbi:hypothetical protein MANES_11G121544v8, partial [Manihot esculenta]